jgi:hypothetical protein
MIMMYVQKLAVIGVLITVIIAVVLTLLITNFTRNANSSLSALPAITAAVVETSSNSTTTNSTNNTTSQIIHQPENLTFSPLTHHPPPPLPAPQNKSLSEQPQENRLRGPPLPSSSEPIHGPVPGTASP